MMIDPVSAIKLSAIVGLACVVVGLPVAVFFGWLLARYDFYGKTLLTVFLFFPLSLPPVITGFMLLTVLGKDSALGAFFDQMGWPLTFSLTGAVIAAFIVGFPLYVMMIRLAFEAVDRKYEDVARTLGLSRFKVFLKVTLPLSLPGILAGAVLTFARAMGEFGATSVISGNIEGETRTISMAVYTLLESPDGITSGRILIIVSVAMSFISIAAYEYLSRWHRRRLELIES